jgi:hypothetical protein
MQVWYGWSMPNGQVPTQHRSLHVIDIENLAGSARPCAQTVASVAHGYALASGMQAGDLSLIASCRCQPGPAR